MVVRKARTSAISSVTAGATVKYKIISNSSCTATNYGSGGTSVTLTSNAGTVTVTNESDNNKYLCFRVTKTNFSDKYFGSAQITGIDDTAPTVASPTFTTSNSNSSYAKQGDTITITLDFSEEIDEGNTTIKYQVGTGTESTFTYTTGTVTSGKCKETTDSTDIYSCKYTVASGDTGRFKTKVSAFKDSAGNSGTARSYNSTGITVDTTAPSKPSAITTKTTSPNSDTTPTFTVTTAETGGTVTLYSDSSCSTAVSSSESVTDSTSPYKTDSTTSAYDTDGTKTVYASQTDVAGNTSACSTANGTYTLDTTAPTITTTVGGTNDNRTVSATDDESSTTMKYKIITGSTSCNATTMSSGTTSYTEGNTITIAVADNGKKVCFSSADEAGNSSYVATAALVTGVALTATVGSVPTGLAQSKDIAISSVTSGATVKYKIISNATCNATNYGSGGTTVTLTSNAGTVTVTNESDNNKYLCFRVTKTNFSDKYFGSAQITGIDDTAPTVANPTFTTSNSNSSYAKQGDTITITLDFSEEIDEGNTTIKYQVGTGTESTFTYTTGTVTSGKCKETTDSTDIYSCKYTVASSDAGIFKTKVSAFKDSAGNSGTAQSYNSTGITVDTTAPTATVTGQPANTNNTTTLSVTVAGTGVTHYKHKTVRGTSCTASGYGSETAIATNITNSISSLLDGSIILCVLGRDAAGNWQTTATSASWTKDTAAPTITATVGGTNDNRTVSATDNETDTTMKYKIITSTETCDATEMSSGTTSYTEGNNIAIVVADNGKKVCFSSVDTAGNSSHTATAALTVAVALTATVGSIPSGSAKSKDVAISSVTSGAAVKYKVISNSSCTATNYGSGGSSVTLSSNAGTVTVTNESDNNKYLCFKVTKSNFSDHYVGSMQITGIDDTPPTATLSGQPANTNTTTTLAVTVAGTGVTHYKHKTVRGTSCTASGYGSETAIATNITDDISSLSDGSIILCVLGRDTAGNWQTTATSASWTKDTTAPTLTISAVSGGYVNATEDNSGVTVSGTTTGADSGSDVDLTFTNGSNTTTISDISVSSNAWTTTLTLTQLTALTEGTISISGAVDDTAGNAATATQSFVYDSTAPTITTTVSGTNDNRTVSASDNDTGATMKRKIITSGTTCGSSIMSSSTTSYTESSTLTIAVADNGKKVCFSSTDAAGNTGYQATATLAVGSALTASVGTVPSGSAKSKDVAISSVTSGAAVKYKVISNSSCTATNYGSGGTSVTLTSNAGTATVTNESDNNKYLCFKITKTNFSDVYVGSGKITGIDDTAPSKPNAITLKTPTSPGNDTTPTFTVTTTETRGSITLYSDSSCSAAVSSSKNVTDNTSPYKTDITTNAYNTDGTKTVYVSHTDIADNTSACSTATGTYILDTAAPTITASIGGTNDNRTVSASDDESGTIMKYKIITSGTTCGSSIMSSSTTSYTESSTLTIAVADNGKKVCFSSTDAAGNTGYQATATLAVGSALTASVGTVPSGSAKSKDVAISSVTSGAAVKYKVISNSSCTATNYGSGGTSVTLTSNAGTATVTNESDNNKYLCFKITKTNFSDVYVGSGKITGIDDTAPTVASPTFTTSNSNSTVAKQGDTITITLDFSEEVDEDTTTIKYQVGTGTESTFTYTTGTVTSGKCKETTDSTDIYSCKYTVGSSDTGIFKTKVSAFKDSAGNSGTAQLYNSTGITMDTANPAKPTSLDLASDDDTGSSNTDNITTTTDDLTITGCAEANSTVEILKDDTSFSTPVTDTADGSTGCTSPLKQFSVTIDLSAQSSAYDITAKATDAAGNTSVASTALSITVDDTAPTITATVGGTLTARSVKGVDTDSDANNLEVQSHTQWHLV